MIRFRIPLVITLVLFSAGTLGFAWWQHSALVRVQADLATAQKRIGELERRQPLLPSARDVIAPADLPEAGPDPVAGQMPEIGERRGGPGPGGRFGRAMMDLSSDPEIAPLLLNQRKRIVATRYGVLLARLGLPPEQTEQLKTLLAEKQLAHSDAQLMARSQGLGRDEVREMAKLADIESDAAIQAMLGAAGFAQLQEYDRTYAQRITVSSLADRLTVAGATLPAVQQEQLIRILVANTAAVSGGSMNAFARGDSVEENPAYLEAKAVSDAAVLQQAGAILTPAQVATLQQIQQEQNEQIKLNVLTAHRLQQLRRERRAGSTPGG